MRRPIALTAIATALLATLTAAVPASAQRGEDCRQPSTITDRAVVSRGGNLVVSSVVYQLPNAGAIKVTPQTDSMRAGYAAARGKVVLVCFRR